MADLYSATILFIRSAKKRKIFFSKAIEENKDNSYLWKHMKELGNQSSQNSIPDELIIDGDTIHQTNDIMHRLNSYFANISDILKPSTQSQPSPAYDFQTLQNYIDN